MHSNVDASSMLPYMRFELKYQLRAAIRDSGHSATTIARQARISRQQMADLLKGKDSTPLWVLSAVCDRLRLSVELQPWPESVYAPGPVRTLVDDVREHLRQH